MINKLKKNEVFTNLAILLCIIYLNQNSQCQNTYFNLNNEFGIHYEGMSQKLVLNVSILYQEQYNDFKYQSGYYFTGLLKKKYSLTSGLKVEEFPIAGFCYFNFIEFGEKNGYVAAKNDDRNIIFKKDLFFRQLE